eukprot:CAMPEP_0176428062 /NCGR_PEP_ID=MMETSP0127-20121128/12937_1 /TAXON_ID=938130 /ORGANISM="Platyophrya macrostoma, Strain WH" /LENGTH=41 /DNA_ID= /DNA_START= /DNA_END= /DNA_ORIENTATION=
MKACYQIGQDLWDPEEWGNEIGHNWDVSVFLKNVQPEAVGL